MPRSQSPLCQRKCRRSQAVVQALYNLGYPVYIRLPAEKTRASESVRAPRKITSLWRQGLILRVDRYLRRLQEAAAAATSNNQETSPEVEPPNSANSPPQHLVSSPLVAKSPTAFLEPSLTPHSNNPPMSLPPSRYPIAADTYNHPYPSQTPQSPNYNAPRSAVDQPNGNPLLHSHASPKTEEIYPQDPYNYPMFNAWSYKQPQVVPLPPPQAVPPLSYYYRPRRLEEIAPRDTISLIIALFFDFVYPLTPCIHKPSFMADLRARREERDPLFFALVMSTVASTLVQVPRSYLPMERSVVRKLAQVSFHFRSAFLFVTS